MTKKSADKTNKKVEKNKTWFANDIILKDAFYDYIVKNKKSPTITKLAEITKLNYNTVTAHLAEMDFNTDLRPKFKLLTDKIIMRLGMEAIKTGKASEVKLWNQIVEGWSEKFEHTGKDGEQLISEVKITIVK